MWAFSSAGRAPPWHGGGHRFDPDKVHQSKIDRAIARFFHIFYAFLSKNKARIKMRNPTPRKPADTFMMVADPVT